MITPPPIKDDNNNDDRNIRILVEDILSTPVDFGAVANKCAMCHKKGSIGEIEADGWKVTNNDFGRALYCPQCYQMLDQYCCSLPKEQIEKTLKEGYDFLYQSKIEQAAQRDDIIGKLSRIYLDQKREGESEENK